jgi:hypothetical protein
MIAGLADAAGWPIELKAAALSAGLTYTSLSDATAAECEAAWVLDLKSLALAAVTDAAAEAAREEYRKAESTPASIIAAAVAVLELE